MGGGNRQNRWHSRLCQNDVYSIAFSPDGKLVATASWDKKARLWDSASGKPVGRPLAHEEPVKVVVFSRNGALLATASDDKTVRLWAVPSGDPVGQPLVLESVITAVAISPDCKLVATTSWDKNAWLWQAATGKPFGRPLTHQRGVSAVTFSPDGKWSPPQAGITPRVCGRWRQARPWAYQWLTHGTSTPLLLAATAR